MKRPCFLTVILVTRGCHWSPILSALFCLKSLSLAVVMSSSCTSLCFSPLLCISLRLSNALVWYLCFYHPWQLLKKHIYGLKRHACFFTAHGHKYTKVCRPFSLYFCLFTKVYFNVLAWNSFLCVCVCVFSLGSKLILVSLQANPHLHSFFWQREWKTQ